MNKETILLSEPQIACIKDKSNWKMIQAAFGSGKSVILHEVARNLLRMDNDDLIINITFDPFTALDKKVEHSFTELCKQENLTKKRSNLISLSLSDAVEGANFKVTDVYNCSSLPTKNIADVMMLLKAKYNKDTVHFLFDEVPQELFSETYSKKLFSCLESSLFKNSVVVIALQSVQKTRRMTELHKDKMTDLQRVTVSQEIDLASTGMKLFKLHTTMRMSMCLHNLKRILEEEIERTPCSLNLEVKTKGKLISHQLKHVPERKGLG